MPDVVIRPATPQDEPAWRRLFGLYLEFYRASIAEAAVASAWRRILDAQSPVGAFVAQQGDAIIGLANYLFHESTWDERPVCYLQDLYVEPAARGGGAARQLIFACEEAARARGAFRLYWLTQEYNGPARSLYDTIVPRSSFIVYRKNLS